METKIKLPSSGRRQERLVRQVVKALKATRKIMFWDLILDHDDIQSRIAREMADGSYTERETVESVIEGIISSHEETMKNAAMEQCHHATKAALASLPNTEGD